MESSTAINAMPAQGLLRLRQILDDPTAKPPLPPIIPVCRATWYAGVKSARFPKPIRISERIVAYRVEDIRALLERGAA